MAVQLALLKSGEQVIADIMELVDENNNRKAYVFSNPYIARLLTSELLVEGGIGQFDEDGEVEHKVAFSPWIVLSQDKRVAVDPSWVVTVVNPHPWIKSSYENKMNDSLEEQNSESQILVEESNG